MRASWVQQVFNRYRLIRPRTFDASPPRDDAFCVVGVGPLTWCSGFWATLKRESNIPVTKLPTLSASLCVRTGD